MSFRVLLVNPNRMKPGVAPIALDYLSASLKVAGFENNVLDLCFSDDVRVTMDNYFRNHVADAVGFSIRNTDDCYYSGQDYFLPRYREMIQVIRDWTSVPLILGGVGFSIMPEAILHYCDVDLGIVGEGEWAFPQLLGRLKAGERYDDIPGLVFRTDDGFRVNTPVFMDLDELPSPRRGAIDNTRYLCEGGMGGFETKRGCPQRCIYCADPVAKGRICRMRSPDKVADEIEYLLELGVDWLHTCDSEFNIPLRHAEAVCEELIRRNLGDKVHWYAYCAPKPFPQHLAYLMKRAGCIGVDFGVDSGHDGVLHRLGRDFTTDDLRQVARICREESLIFMYDLLLGGPGETQQTARETIELMREVNPSRVGVAVGVRIYPGTPLAEMVHQAGVTPDNPHLQGMITGNFDFLGPIFYLSADLGSDPLPYVGDLVGDDDRFFFAGSESEGLSRSGANYNYNENQLLVEAIQQGHRGAFWDILRRLREEDG